MAQPFRLPLYVSPTNTLEEELENVDRMDLGDVFQRVIADPTRHPYVAGLATILRNELKQIVRERYARQRRGSDET